MGSEASCRGDLVRLLGQEHPDTLTSMNNLASVLRAMAELTLARKCTTSAQ
jgi:hypothetical protein